MKEIRTDPDLLEWASKHLGKPILQPAQAFGLVVDGEVRAVFVFNCFTGPDIEMSVATLPGTPWPRAFLRRMAHYVFGELGCQRVSITTEQPVVVDLITRFGAVVEGVKRHAFGLNRDGTCLGLYPERVLVR